MQTIVNQIHILCLRCIKPTHGKQSFALQAYMIRKSLNQFKPTLETSEKNIF